MKRIFTITCAALFLCLLCASAGAAQFEGAARELSTIGIFRGTSGGFELDRAPTRAEAAIMLTRLFGAEDAAKTAYAAGEISCPFADVSAFSAPYVAWLYDRGIVNGTGATTFGAANPCTLKNYTAFLLRALGYVDGADFQYADTLSFARKIGLGNPFIFPHGKEKTRAFLRDDLAEMTYEALFTDKKGGETWLLQSLLDGGALDADAAAPLRAKMEQIRASLRGELEGDNPNPWRELSEQEKLVLKRGGKLLCDYDSGAYIGIGYPTGWEYFKEYVAKDNCHRRVECIGNKEAWRKERARIFAMKPDVDIDALVEKDLAALTDDGDYPQNANGETYGYDILSDYVGYSPDMIAGIGTYGEHGYVRRSEMPGPRMFEDDATDFAESSRLYDKWAKENPPPWTLNVYDSEGNVIGEFDMGSSDSVDDILATLDTEGMSIEEVKTLVGELY